MIKCFPIYSVVSGLFFRTNGQTSDVITTPITVVMVHLKGPMVYGLGPFGIFRAWGQGHSIYSLSLQCHLSVTISLGAVRGFITCFCYRMTLDISCHLSEVAVCELGKEVPVSRVVRICKWIYTLHTVPGTENVLNMCSYFFSYFDGGGVWRLRWHYH